MMIKCTKSKAVCAFVVPAKGVDPDKYSTKKITNFVEWLGHTRLLLKSDNEPAVNALIQDALKTTRGNRAKAARLLNTTERILNYQVRKYGIDWQRFKA